MVLFARELVDQEQVVELEQGDENVVVQLVVVAQLVVDSEEAN